MAVLVPMLPAPAVPTPPWNSAASSVRMSPYRLGKAKTWKLVRRLGSTSLAVMMSMYQPSHSIPSKSSATLRAASRKAPSVVLTTFALVTIVTEFLPLSWRSRTPRE